MSENPDGFTPCRFQTQDTSVVLSASSPHPWAGFRAGFDFANDTSCPASRSQAGFCFWFCSSLCFALKPCPVRKEINPGPFHPRAGFARVVLTLFLLFLFRR
jgi:hypothetical protein